MNKEERSHLELVDYKIDSLMREIEGMKRSMDDAHRKTDESLKFIKENLFNPKEGLWAESQLYTQFRKSSQKWRSIVGVGFVSLIIKQVYDLFQR